MSVQNPHHFSPLWLFSNSKQINTQRNSKSGFATLNGGHIPIKSNNYKEPATENIITNIPNINFKSKTSEFPSLQSTKPTKVGSVDNGAWSQPRGKGKLYNSVKQNNKTTGNNSNNTKSRNTEGGNSEKPNSPKSKAPKAHDTSKFDFFKSLRQDEGLIDSDTESNSYENDKNIENKVQDIPLSSSVETEHRLLKEMGWSDATEPPLTEEEVYTARLEIEKRQRNRSPPALSPFPWAPKMYLPDEDADETVTDSDDDY